jgi:oligoendopeptidase F
VFVKRELPDLVEMISGVTINETKLIRRFLPDQLTFEQWENLEPYFANLAERQISTEQELLTWLSDWSELDAVFDEEMAWRYIRSTCDTTNEEIEKALDFFIAEIEPKVAPWSNQLNQKLCDLSKLFVLNPDVYGVLLRSTENQIAIYREKNIPIYTEIDQLKQRYGKITGDLMVEMEGNELTLQQAGVYLKNIDRSKREEVFHKIWAVRLAQVPVLDPLFDQLCVLRNQVAANAGFENFRDYSFASLDRFDYTKEDCFRFHEAVEKEVIPFLTELQKERANKLGLETLRPWDRDVDLSGKAPLHPFSDGKELAEKTVNCLMQVRPRYAEYLQLMNRLGHFDLDSRKGKAPGGYNYSLAETGVPFIFMNAAGLHRDLITMVHEAGHAIHSFLENHLPLNGLKSPPSEVCELASMSMELISMKYWYSFYDNEDDLKRAKIEQLENMLSILPWVACVDAFQHWVYENKNHTAEERSDVFMKLIRRFDPQGVDWTGLEEILRYNWQKQLHIFEVPFYYIEYGMAQLGAIAVWRNYSQDPEKALDAYEAALKLGNTQTIGKIYEAAGIRFDFSKEYVRELVAFVKDELAKTKAS